MKVVFWGSSPFATPIFEALVGSEAHDVLGLVTPPDRPRGRGRDVVRSDLARRADEAGIPVLQPESTKDPAFVERMAAFEADVFVVASYGEILRRDIIEMCPNGALNVHASLLPRWRGASPIQRAIAAGDEVTGVSIQRMVLALDAGDVLLSRETPIGPDDTAADLFERLADLGARAILDALDAIDSGTATFTPQDESRVTLAPKLSKTDGIIDFDQSPDDIDRHVRAMTTWPGARTTLPDGRGLIVLACENAGEAENDDAAPGTLLGREDLDVACAHGGAVRLLRVKPAGKGAMDGAAFRRGAQLPAGSRFSAE